MLRDVKLAAGTVTGGCRAGLAGNSGQLIVLARDNGDPLLDLPGKLLVNN